MTFRTAEPSSPGADHFAVAIIAACRETGEDPIKVASGGQPSRGRAYAFHALRACFDGLRRETAARLTGAADARLAMHSMKVARYQSRWWSPEALDRVAAEVRGVDVRGRAAAPPAPVRAAAAPVGAAAAPVPAKDIAPAPPRPEEFPTDVAPRPARPRRAQDHWAAPPSRAGRAVDATGEICGDPPPGRSALDRRRAEEAPGGTDAGIAPMTSALLKRRSPHASAVNFVHRREHDLDL